MKILIIDNADIGHEEFNEPLVKAISKLVDYDVVNYSDVDPDGTLISSYDGVVLSGVPLHYSYESMYERMEHLSWIKTTDVPVLGICLGHQMIGKLFGASLIRDKEAENSTRPMNTLADDPIFKDMGSGFQAKALHRGSITLPDGFKLLASSAKCENQIMRHEEKDIYGVQFHPERLSANGALFVNFVAIVENHNLIAIKNTPVLATENTGELQDLMQAA